MLIGTLSLCLWIFGYAHHLNVAGSIVIKTNTALGLLLGGVSLALLSRTRARAASTGFAVLLAVLIFILGALTITEHTLGWNFQIDELFARESPGAPATVSPNRMGPLSAICFALLGLALLTIAAGRRGIAPLFGVAIGVMMLIPGVGYPLGILPFYSLPDVTGIAWPTVLAFLVLGAGLVAVYPESGPMALLLRRDQGGRLLRAVLLPTLLGPLSVAVLNQAGQSVGWYSASAGLGLVVIALTVIMTVMLFRHAKSISEADQEQRRAAAALRESDARFRRMADDAPVMVWVADRDGRYTFLSKSWLEFAGRSLMKALGQSWLESIHPEDEPAARLAFAEAQATQLAFRLEHRMRRADDAYCWVLNTVAPRFDVNGKTVGFVGSSLDISSLKQSENDRALLASIVQFSDDAMITKTFDGTVTSWNRGAERLFGYTAEEAIGRSILLLIPPERRQEEEHIVERLRAGEHIEHFETVRVCKDGRKLDISLTISPMRDAHGRLIGASKVARDITLRKRIEAALRESEQMFRTLADNMSQLAWMADGVGSVFWYNKRWFDYTGTTLEQMHGWGWMSIQHPDHLDRVVASIKHSWDTGAPWEDTFPIRGHNGEYRWFLSRAVPIRDEQGRIVRWFGTNTDITERREFEAALTVAKEAAESADRAKDHFLAVLSHELRTPLTPVQMAISSLEADATLPATVQADISMMRRNVEHEIQLIDDLLDLNRIRFGKLKLCQQPIHINELVEHLCADCRSTLSDKRLSVTTALDPSIGLMMADHTRTKQVLWNVIRNAIKFTPDGGTVEVQSIKAGDRTRIVVRDNGVGIAPSDLERIFGAFEQSHHKEYGGLGLGLAISKSLVELHGGTINAKSDGLGCGTTITIELPANEVVANEAAAALPNETLRKSKHLRLLVVEDHVDTARLLKRLLEMSGYSVRTAVSMAEAIAFSASDSFDVIISDVGLPDGSGYELMRQLRRRGVVRGIAMSGYGMDEDVRLSHDAGFAEHLVKPIDVDELEQALRRVTSAD